MEVLAKDHGIPRPWRAEGGGVAEPFEGLRVLRRTNLFENYLRYFVAEPSEVVETVRHSSLMVKNKLIRVITLF
jgi:hypothetical protein